MTLEEFAQLVNDMRLAQREYFRTRSQAALDASKVLERKVDKAVKSVLDKQARLFE